MKKTFLSIIGCLTLLTILTGCASYRATPLNINTFASEIIQSTESENGIVVKAKAFNKYDCERYLDRNVIAKGYQPVQLYIQNSSSTNYSFSLNRISLPYASTEEVARRVHTSTVGRVVGYGVASLFLWPFVIPAIVDGIKSSEANDSLDSDFSGKVAKDQVIYAHAYFNKIIFVPVNDYQPNITVTLVEEGSKKASTFNVPILD